MITDLGSCLHGVSQVTHHHLGLVLLLVGTGQPAESLEDNKCFSLCGELARAVPGSSCKGRSRTYLTADDAGEVSLLWRVDVELSLVSTLSPVLGTDLQGQSVIVAHVDLLPVAVSMEQSQ